MTGERLKQILLRTGENLTTISRKLEISTQALNSLFRAADVRTGTIEKMCDKLGLNAADFFADGDMIKAENHSIAFKGNDNDINTNDEKFLALLAKKDEQMDRLITIIENMQQ